ncbi:hypothetical protein CcaCcLH18_05033 [Colletotrichum camelliae]|nr:hypothetical protein CcaCcLH18_05033 [Colletotrichum camelliae]
MRKNKKSQQARRHVKRLKRLEMKALSEGDLHLSKTVEPGKNHENGLNSQDAPSSLVKTTRLARLKVANKARKNTNLNVSFLRRDVRQFKDATSSEINEKFADFEEKMRVQLYSFFDVKMRQEWSIKDMKMLIASQEAHMSRQTREMDTLRSDIYGLRMELEKEREDNNGLRGLRIELEKEREERKVMEDELRRDMDKLMKDTDAAKKKMMENPKDLTRGAIEKAHSNQGDWKGRLRQGVRR